MLVLQTAVFLNPGSYSRHGTVSFGSFDGGVVGLICSLLNDAALKDPFSTGICSSVSWNFAISIFDFYGNQHQREGLEGVVDNWPTGELSVRFRFGSDCAFNLLPLDLNCSVHHK